MKENKVAFITCVSDQKLYQKSLAYINNLQIPEGIEVEIIPIMTDKSITTAYNEAMNKSDSKYKVYLHEDVYIQNTKFIYDILNIFKSDENIGIIGVAGAKIIPISGIWKEDPRKVGKIFQNNKGCFELLKYNKVKDLYTEVKGIDGLIMITQYDLLWRDDIFNGRHFYDLSQCVEFLRKGFKVVVPNQENAWCIHDCADIDTSEDLEVFRNKFLDTYSKDIFPLVSILIPAYNQTKYLQQALDSALNQNYRNTEIIICDDSTTSDVQKLVEEYMLKTNKIKYFNNGGPSGDWGISNMERCFKESTGEYINYLFHDDLFNSNKIDKMINYFLYDDTLSLVTSYRKLINENGDYLNDTVRTSQQFPHDTRLTGEEAGRRLLFSLNNYIGEPTTAMFKRSAVNFTINGYDKYDIHCLVDAALWLNLLRQGNMVYISEPLSKFRIHLSQNSNDSTLAFWFPIEYFKLIISSYENGVFIKYRSELLNALTVWYNQYSKSIINFTSIYNNTSKYDTQIMKIKDEYINCYTKFINILLE